MWRVLQPPPPESRLPGDLLKVAPCTVAIFLSPTSSLPSSRAIPPPQPRLAEASRREKSRNRYATRSFLIRSHGTSLLDVTRALLGKRSCKRAHPSTFATRRTSRHTLRDPEQHCTPASKTQASIRSTVNLCLLCHQTSCATVYQSSGIHPSKHLRNKISVTALSFSTL